MAITTAAVLAGAALAVTAYSAYEQSRQAGKAQRASDKAAEEQKKINREARASEEARAAQERRQQIREERIRRAKILQSAENAGVSQSSGALGSISALSTNLGANLGFNLSEVSRGRRMGSMMDRRSDYLSQSQRFQNTSAMWGGIGNLSSSIFSSVGGFGAFGLDIKASK